MEGYAHSDHFQSPRVGVLTGVFTLLTVVMGAISHGRHKHVIATFALYVVAIAVGVYTKTLIKYQAN